ncbi:MAG: hypothetical protein JOZ81_26000, partial [Chloroflexi bacterium]|nr:hypothetical protein [Chloroflexota bacterium]
TDQNAPGVVAVCRRVDALPLAIELAAARIAVLTIDELLQRLDDRFGLLTGGPRTAPARQQALRATLDWSWELLSAQEQLLLRRLAVFAGGWALEAASMVCGDDQLRRDEVAAVSWRLVASSMVVAEERAGAMRYRLLETVRTYAWEQLEAAGEAEVVRARHRAWCLALISSSRGAEWARAIELELSNVRAALDWSETEEGAGEAGLQLATGLRGLWVRGRRREGRDRVVQLLQRSTASVSRVRARALALAGHLSSILGDDAAAETFVNQSLDLWRRLGDPHGLADALCDAGSGAHLRGDHVAAARLIRESLTLAETVGNTYRQCQGLMLLGAVLRSLGGHDEAAATFAAGLAVARAHDHAESTAFLLLESANLALLRDDPVHAAALLKDSLIYWRRFDSAHGLARSIEALGRAACASGQATRAARLLGAAEVTREQLGVTLRPDDPVEHQRAVAAARGRLGEKRFAAAWSAGRAMSLAQAVTYAVVAQEPRGSRKLAHPGRAAGAEALTTRERDVIRLVAHGLGNRQIAERLIVSERTVAAHIEHVLNKLGVSSRTQIALWAAASGQLGPKRS